MGRQKVTEERAPRTYGVRIPWLQPRAAPGNAGGGGPQGDHREKSVRVRDPGVLGLGR